MKLEKPTPETSSTKVASIVSSIKARYRQFLADIDLLLNTPQFRKFLKKIEPVLKKFNAFKQQLMGFVSGKKAAILQRKKPVAKLTSPSQAANASATQTSATQPIAQPMHVNQAANQAVNQQPAGQAFVGAAPTTGQDQTIPASIQPQAAAAPVTASGPTTATAPVTPFVAAAPAQEPASSPDAGSETGSKAKPKRAKSKTKRAKSKIDWKANLARAQATFGSLLFKGLALALVAGIAYAVWTAYQTGDPVLAFSILAVALGALFGYWSGVLGLISSLVGMAVAYFATPIVAPQFDHLMAEAVGTSGLLNRLLTLSAFALIVYLAFSVLMPILAKVFSGPSEEKSLLYKALGVVGGAASAALGVLVLLSSFSIAKPLLAWVKPEMGGQPNRIAMLDKAIEASQLRPWAERYNPFEKVPYLNKVTEIQQTVSKLNSAEQIRYLMRHPSVMELRQSEEMKEAVIGLTGDAKFVDLMKANGPFDQDDLLTIMRSDAVLKVIDQPGFVKTALDVFGSPKEIAESNELEPGATKTLYTSQPQ